MLSIRVAILLIAVPLQACAGDLDPAITVLEFTSDVCMWCRKMRPVVETLKREGYPIRTVDYHQQRIEAEWHGVSEVPAYVVFRRGHAERVLYGVQGEQALREVFRPACAPAGRGRGQILPRPADDWKEERLPAPELPPTPQPEALPDLTPNESATPPASSPLPPPAYGPYDRDRTCPPPKANTASAGDPADILIYSYGSNQHASAAAARSSPPQQAHPDPTPEESATLESHGQTEQHATAEEFAAALAEARARILGGTDAQATPGTATTDPAAGTSNQAQSDCIASRGERDGSTTGTFFDLLGVSRGEAVVWLISVGLGAAGFTWGGPLGAKLAKTVGLAVVRLILRQQLPKTDVESQPASESVLAASTATLPHLQPDYAKLWAECFAASGGNPQHEAIKLQLYVEAVELLRKGEICPQANGKAIADALDDWVMERFFNRVPKALPKSTDENFYHKALMGFLYREAVDRLRIGHIQVLGHRETADALDHWVRKEFYRKVVKPTKQE